MSKFPNIHYRPPCPCPLPSGEAIAQSLSITYNGPHLKGDKVAYFTFTDPQTGSSFGATDLEEARKTLAEMREKFGVSMLKESKEPLTREEWLVTKEGQEKLKQAVAEVRTDNEQRFRSSLRKNLTATDKGIIERQINNIRQKPLEGFDERRAELLAMKDYPDLKPSSPREPWQMTKAEYESIWGKPRKNTTVTGGFNPHKEAVMVAMNQGKPVPPEVLADYPDLKPTPKIPYAQLLRDLKQAWGTSSHVRTHWKEMIEKAGYKAPEKLTWDEGDEGEAEREETSYLIEGFIVDKERKTISTKDYTLNMDSKFLTIPVLNHTYKMRGWSEFYDKYGNDLFIKLNALGRDYTDVDQIVIKLRDKAYELWGKEIKFP